MSEVREDVVKLITMTRDASVVPDARTMSRERL
jgi:hypothetical protein